MQQTYISIFDFQIFKKSMKPYSIAQNIDIERELKNMKNHRSVRYSLRNTV